MRDPDSRPYLILSKMTEFTGISSFRYSNNYFWRTYDMKEVDWMEEREGCLFGYEFTWGQKKQTPKLWLDAYPEATFECFNQENYLPYIT